MRILSTIIRRLRWRGSGARLGDGTDPATIARTLAYLFGFGAVLLALSLLIEGSPAREPAPIAAVAAAALLFAGFLIAGYERLPRWFLALAPGVGTIMAGLVIYYGGPSSSAAYAMYLSWVVIAAGCFFSAGVTLAHGAAAVGVYAVALEVSGTTASTGLQLLMMAGSAAVAAGVMCGLAGQRREVVRRLEDAAHTDPLTEVLNRRAFTRAFDVEQMRARRHQRPVGLILIDLDNLKQRNDALGHPEGDAALRRVGRILLETTRGSDVVARMGGDEFAVLAPETDTPRALVAAGRLRQAVELEFSGEAHALTVSCGVASSPEAGLSYGDVMSRADQALYRAKAAGRNRVKSARSAELARGL